MTENQTPPEGAPVAPAADTPAAPTGPRVPPHQMRDLTQLRRSITDRRIAGVAGGIGRHFDIDPTLIRVVLAVLAFFGGAGLLIYAAVWLLVPEDGQTRAALHTSPDLQKALLLTAGAMAAVFALGAGWGSVGYNATGWVVPILIILAVIALISGRSTKTVDPAMRTAAAVPAGTATYGAAGQAAYTDPSSPVGQDTRRFLPAYTPPSAPRRTGMILFWPTLALITFALGIMGLYDVNGRALAPGAYAAVALALIGLALLVGAFIGRPGGLIALGLLGVFALISTTFIGLTGGVNGYRNPQTISLSPTTATQVPAVTTFKTGSVLLDLTQVSDLAALDGRHLAITGRAGEVTVLLPPDANFQVSADARVAGEVVLGDATAAGLHPHLTRSVGPPGGPTVYLDIDVRFGQITVRN